MAKVNFITVYLSDTESDAIKEKSSETDLSISKLALELIRAGFHLKFGEPLPKKEKDIPITIGMNGSLLEKMTKRMEDTGILNIESYLLELIKENVKEEPDNG